MNPNFEYISCAELNELLEDPGKRLMLIDCQKPNLKNPKERIEKTIKFSHHLVPEEYGFPEPSKHHERKIKLLDEMLATESEQFFVFYSLSEDYYLEKIILDTIRYLLNVVFRKENIKYKILEGGLESFSKQYPKSIDNMESKLESENLSSELNSQSPVIVKNELKKNTDLNRISNAPSESKGITRKKNQKNLAITANYLENIIDRKKSEQPVNIEKAKMSQINDYLYLGNAKDAENKELLNEAGITHIINVTPDIPNYHVGSFEYYRVGVKDADNEDIEKYFNQTTEFIEEAKFKNGKVLVHCQAGISRSATIVIAYLKKLEPSTTIIDHLTKLQEKRPIAHPRIQFMLQLEHYQIPNSTIQQFSS